MQNKTIKEIDEKYDLELERVINTINREKSKKVLLQFPEGMKPYSTVILQELEAKTKSKCFIWLGSCFGACDVPIEVQRLGVDLIVQFGHSDWEYGSDSGVSVLK